jgi:hypothetical protein
MTELKGQLHRSIACPRIGRPVIVTLDAETKRIGFHEKGCHHIYWLPIATAFEMAIATDGKRGKA